MSERFADLSRTEFFEYESIALLAIQFFSPLNNKKYKEELGLPNKDVITPLSVSQFYFYLRKIDKQYESKIYKINSILSIMERRGILTFEGLCENVMLGRCYYMLKEFSILQRKNTLWLGDAFGLGYLNHKLTNNVVHITGKNEKHGIGNGTGFLINKNTVLTCKHVVEDMIPDKTLSIMGDMYEYCIKSHSEKDIALLVLDKPVENVVTFPTFNNCNVLDDVLIMGYPPIPCSDDAYMLSQKGEVNAIVRNYLTKVKSIVLSSVTRPGNSGGPVISRNGYFVGMITQFTVSGEMIGTNEDKDKGENGENKPDRFPFYMAMDAKELYDGIKDIDKNIDIEFENYQ